MELSVLEKRDDVIKKSAKLFYYNGYNNTGLSMILKECNIPKGSFYYYFKNKEDLLINVIEYHTDKLLNFFDYNVDDLEIEKLRTFFKKYFLSIEKNQYHGGSILGNLAIEMSDINDEVRQKILDNYRKIELRLILYLEMLKKSKLEYMNLDAEMTAKIILNQMEGTMLRLKLNKDSKEVLAFFSLFDKIFNIAR
ncbi:TetR/AcrR family transcriptional regulator [Oceanivirga miroungae]|uniref:TetR family transcriptional regulator n=1 Tax=Oceanivirga miroungae TaxID=1130046 RepID=A0A6I8MEU5_9FUSO|nr:TetR/AcrR family transcriptional regulator [Oceanivirga miroungae]VWL85759.1 TetR family transcriptional regulator [Oceanivirga miroungae]